MLTVNVLTLLDNCGENCDVFFDGCNVCNCGSGICTHKTCDEYETSFCATCIDGYYWNNNTRQCENQDICPQNCQLYYDGCNECVCKGNNGSLICGKLVCFQKEKAECLECNAGYEWNPTTMKCEQKCINRCDVWFDGCNDYVCHDNKIIGKSRKICEVYEDPYCKKCENNLKWNDCGSACTPTCLNSNPFCSMICVPRCECPGNEPLLNNDYCIKKEDCFIHLLDG